MTAPLPPVELGYRLADVYRVLGPLYRLAQRWVENDEATSGMSIGARAVLDELSREAPATVPQIARRLHLSRQFIQRMVNEAEGQGLLSLRANPAHARSWLVELTPAGVDAIGRVHDREHELLGEVTGGLTTADIDTTLRVLRLMHAAVEERNRAQ